MSLKVIYMENGKGKTHYANVQKEKNNAIVIDSKITDWKLLDGKISHYNTINNHYLEKLENLSKEILKVSFLNDVFSNLSTDVVKKIIKDYKYNEYETLKVMIFGAAESYTSSQYVAMQKWIEDNDFNVRKNIHFLRHYQIYLRILNSQTESVFEDEMSELNEKLDQIKEDAFDKSKESDDFNLFKKLKLKEIEWLVDYFHAGPFDGTPLFIARMIKNSNVFTEMELIDDERKKLLENAIMFLVDGKTIDTIDVEGLSDGQVVSKVLTSIKSNGNIILDDTLEKLDITNLLLVLGELKNANNSYVILTHNPQIVQIVDLIDANDDIQTRIETIDDPENPNTSTTSITKNVTSSQLISNIIEMLKNGVYINIGIMDFIGIFLRKSHRDGFHSHGHNLSKNKNINVYKELSESVFHYSNDIDKDDLFSMGIISQELYDVLPKNVDSFILLSKYKELLESQTWEKQAGLNRKKMISYVEEVIKYIEIERDHKGEFESNKSFWSTRPEKNNRDTAMHKLELFITSITN